MAECADYIELTYRTINCFADDGKLDIHELDKLLKIAKRDGVVDSNEKRVLVNIFGRLKPGEVSDELQWRISEVREMFGI